ncbi:MAG: response regulator transcription factor [Pseudomonadota bacterium]
MNNLTVLYVEDDDIVRENFELILQRYFCRVIVAGDGKKALQLYQQYKPDIALLDISIPYISGLQLASKIREVDTDIQIIMLTAYTDQEKLLHAVNLQLFAYLVKPISQTELDSCLRNVIDKFQTLNILNLTGGYRWDKKNEWLYYSNEKIKLTNNERLIIALLCNYPNRFFTAAHIISTIFENESDKCIDYNSLVQIISRFKNKVRKNNNMEDFFIENTYGAGYRILLDDSKLVQSTPGV